MDSYNQSIEDNKQQSFVFSSEPMGDEPYTTVSELIEHIAKVNQEYMFLKKQAG